MKIYTPILLFFCLAAQLTSEIVDVHISWNPKTCDARCAALLEKGLKTLIPGLPIDVDSTQGSASFPWRPQKIFQPSNIIDRAKRSGIVLDTMRVTIIGTLSQVGKKYYVQSLGDPTKIQLMAYDRREAFKEEKAQHQKETKEANINIKDPFQTQSLKEKNILSGYESSKIQPFIRDGLLVQIIGNINLNERNNLQIQVEQLDTYTR